MGDKPPQKSAPASPSTLTGDNPAPSDDEEMRWAGHGHVGAFLVQFGSLILVNLAIWGFVFLMALKLLGKPMPWNW